MNFPSQAERLILEYLYIENPPTVVGQPLTIATEQFQLLYSLVVETRNYYLHHMHVVLYQFEKLMIAFCIVHCYLIQTWMALRSN